MGRNAVLLCVCLTALGLFAQVTAEAGPSRLYSSRKLQANPRRVKKNRGSSGTVPDDMGSQKMGRGNRSGSSGSRGSSEPVKEDTTNGGSRIQLGEPTIVRSSFEQGGLRHATAPSELLPGGGSSGKKSRQVTPVLASDTLDLYGWDDYTREYP
ncbi:hypothetical protein BSKO_11271 [Bryopsis sp. KO-2023]|nr:hypothetical protein BSKO_11271 [Bryopsis sp. KO-2023]